MFLWWFETPPPSGRGGSHTNERTLLLYISGTNQENGTKFGVCKFLRTRNVSMVVWDSSPPEKGAPIQIKQILLNILRTNQANGTKIGMWEFLKARNVCMVV